MDFISVYMCMGGAKLPDIESIYIDLQRIFVFESHVQFRGWMLVS